MNGGMGWACREAMNNFMIPVMDGGRIFWRVICTDIHGNILMQRQKALAAARKRRYYSITALKKCFEIAYSCVLLFQTAFPAAPAALFSRRG